MCFILIYFLFLYISYYENYVIPYVCVNHFLLNYFVKQ